MTHTAGIDLSSRAIDIVKLEESSNRAEWFRFELVGASAWERTLVVRDCLPGPSFWDDVYLCAIETPFPDQQGVLRRVQGAVMATIPASVLVWEANAAQWKRELGLKGKPGNADLSRVAPNWLLSYLSPLGRVSESALRCEIAQDALDAFCVALWARESNAKGIAA